jgi:clan AA aspartic protease (TIGR02281 family)
MKIALLLSCLINIVLIGTLYILLNVQASSWLKPDLFDPNAANTLTVHDNSEQQAGTFAHSTQQASSLSSDQNSINQGAVNQIAGALSFSALLSLAEEGKWQVLAPLLTEYLYQYPEHVQAQLLEGRVIIHTQTSAAGLEYLYTLLHKLNSPQDIELVASYINDHAQPIIDALSDNQDWTALATFVEPLIQYESQAVTYIEPLALAYAMLNLPDAMENTLASLPAGHQLIPQTRRLWSEQFAISPQNSRDKRQVIDADEQTRQADIRVALTQRDGQWFSPFNIGSEHFELLLDTGASTTAISGDAFFRIPKRQRTFLGRILINTASGQAQARLYNVTNVAIGPWKIAQLDVLVLPVERLSGFDGLLGMNVLNRSQVVIDQISGALEVRLPDLSRSQRND